MRIFKVGLIVGAGLMAQMAWADSMEETITLVANANVETCLVNGQTHTCSPEEIEVGPVSITLKELEGWDVLQGTWEKTMDMKGVSFTMKLKVTKGFGSDKLTFKASLENSVDDHAYTRMYVTVKKLSDLDPIALFGSDVNLGSVEYRPVVFFRYK